MSGSNILAINSNRIPDYCIDLNYKTGEIVKTMKIDKSTAWEDVPIAAF